MTTDLRNDEQLEQRLRAACHAVIPHLGDRPIVGDEFDDHDHDLDEASTLATVTAFPTVRATGRTRLVGIAAAALLVAGGAAVWAANGRPASDNAGAVALSQPLLQYDVVATVLATPTGSSVPCFDTNCTPLDRLPVVAGAADFYVGPESLGTAVVNQKMLDQVGIIRCLELTAYGSDGSACQRIEGIAGVGLVSYPTNISAPSTVAGDQAAATVDIEVGTTFTDVSPADYADNWAGSGDGANGSPMVVRGHDGIRYHYASHTYVVWQEQPGVLVWVAVPDEMADQLSTIADGVRRTPGPATIPYIVVVTPLASPWGAHDNNGNGLLYARVGGTLLVGIDYIDSTEGRPAIVARQNPGVAGELVVGGMAPVDAAQLRITTAGNVPAIFDTIAFAGAPEARFFMVNVPGGPGSITIDWLAADGSELGGELAQAVQADVQVDSTVTAKVG
ncbi:MAG TPA: hypothetical protein PK020_12175 [Ilumatobacteraceae bacterium]|nr:hypothetical protein [Ilumatobacteraceae bacterium]HRB03508.1 hypothetical protein [Ilumatobacteraceae bacterium]